jgi:hypothetical protein
MNLTPKRVAKELKKVLEMWLVDSGATHHFCGQRKWFESFVPLQIPVKAAETTLNATGYGTIHLELKNGRVVTLKDVIYIPNLDFNVISTERIKKDNALGYKNHDPHGLFDLRTNQLIEAITVKSDLPTIGGTKALTSKFGIGLHYAEARPKGITMDLAHRRLGHFSETYIRQLADGLATGLTLTTKRLAKQRREASFLLACKVRFQSTILAFEFHPANVCPFPDSCGNSQSVNKSSMGAE